MSATVQGNEVRKILAQFDAPAFVRRARGVEVADELLDAVLTRHREEWLDMPRIRLAQLHALLGDLQRLAQLRCSPRLIEALQQLVGQWNPKTRTRVARVASVVDAASALRRLGESFARFNGRWKGFVDAFDLTEINTIRDGYNRYYVLEKECSTGSAVLARRGFEPLPMLTAMSLLKKYPLLPDV